MCPTAQSSYSTSEKKRRASCSVGAGFRVSEEATRGGQDTPPLEDRVPTKDYFGRPLAVPL